MDLNETSSNINEEALICGFTEECDFMRFFFITALSGIALCGIFNNGLLAWIFMKHQCPNTPPTLYPTFLAILDGLICCFYIFLFGFDVVMIFLRIESLFVIYHTYIVPAFVLSKVTQLAIPYLLIFVTLERYAWISEHMKNSSLFSTKGRPISVICCLCCCVLLRSPPLWALTVDVYPDCPDFFRSLAVAPYPWVMESEFYAFYDFWLMAFIQTVLPFIVLVATNIIIIKRLSAVHAIEKQQMQKLQQQQALPPTPKSSTSLNPFHEIRRASMKKLSFSTKRMPASVRNAVYTTMAIVASYLICNTLHLFLTVLERSKASILEDKEDPLKASTFYTFFGDSVSALYMVTSAIRIFIYCKCNPVVKQQVVETLSNLFSREHHDDVTKVKPTQCFITIENDKFSSQCPSEEV